MAIMLVYVTFVRYRDGNHVVNNYRNIDSYVFQLKLFKMHFLQVIHYLILISHLNCRYNLLS